MKKAFLFILVVTLLIDTGNAQVIDDETTESLKRQFKLSGLDQITEKIELNRDTILLAGYLSNPEIKTDDPPILNVIYKTTDSGLTWTRREFDGDAWIYTSFYTNDGNIWLGGSDHHIHHSSDYGETWKKISKPFIPSDRIRTINMINNETGIAGGLFNGLAITNDNWKTSTQIDSPFDQNKISVANDMTDKNIEKVAMLDSIFLISQNGQIFYSDLHPINWKKFNKSIIDFEWNIKNKEVYLKNNMGKEFILSKDLELVRTNFNKKLTHRTLIYNTFKIENFFNNKIKSVEILFKKNEDCKVESHDSIYEKNQKLKTIKFFCKNDIFSLPEKKIRRIQFSHQELKDIFHPIKLRISIEELKNHLKFDNSDFKDYTNFLNNRKQNNASHNYFQNYKEALNKISKKNIAIMYDKKYIESLLKTKNSCKIRIKLVNTKGQYLIISNKGASLYSLPWILIYDNEEVETYNPFITKFVKSIIPKEFECYEKLLSGELIFNLIKELIASETNH